MGTRKRHNIRVDRRRPKIRTTAVFLPGGFDSQQEALHAELIDDWLKCLERTVENATGSLESARKHLGDAIGDDGGKRFVKSPPSFETAKAYLREAYNILRNPSLRSGGA